MEEYLIEPRDEEIRGKISLIVPIGQRGQHTWKQMLATVRHLVDEVVVVEVNAAPEWMSEAVLLADKSVAWESGSTIDFWQQIKQLATYPFLLWINPDEALTTEGQGNLQALKQKMTVHMDAASFLLCLERDECTEGCTSMVRRNRLVRRDINFRWNSYIHDFVMQPEANLVHCAIELEYIQAELF